MRVICLRIFIVVKSHALEEEIGYCYYIFVYKIYKMCGCLCCISSFNIGKNKYKVHTQKKGKIKIGRQSEHAGTSWFYCRY